MEDFLWQPDFLIEDRTTHGGNNVWFGGRGKGRDFIIRILCMKLVNEMPSEGLDECVHTLKDMYEFYSFDQQLALPAKSVEKVQARISE